MSAPALIRKQDMLRAAEVAQATGCRIDIKVGDTVVSINPTDQAEAPRPASAKSEGIDYSRPDL